MIGLLTFLLAQADIDPPPVLETPMGAGPAGPPKMDPAHASSLINISALMLVLPMLVLIGLIAWVVINSPIGAPLFKPLAENAYKNKKYARAAKLYAKLHDMLELMEGGVYARKTAQCYELSGNLREAQRWYEKADDWAKVGQLLMEAGSLDRAVEIFREHNMPSKLAHCYEQIDDPLHAGEVYELQLKNYHKAEVMYKKAGASSDKETSLEAKLRLARVLHQLARAEDARHLFDEVSRELSSSVQYQEFPDLLGLQAEVKSLLEA